MDKEQKGQTKEKNYSMDVDRMINEGLAGGTVSDYYNQKQIEEARDLEEEEPPNH
ncbi:hypothetical protein [Alteribacillus sp. HJP-4]|uniref:hypothetical protein n=1 Tax=Alteribacillus sp. HJP-4 TaxID=2775394 RepID=UPI0035CCDE48